MPVILKFVRLQSVPNVEVKILQNNLPAATHHHQTFQTSIDEYFWLEIQ